MAHFQVTPLAEADGVSENVLLPAFEVVLTVITPVVAAHETLATLLVAAETSVNPAQGAEGIVPPLLEMFSVTVVLTAEAAVIASAERARTV